MDSDQEKYVKHSSETEILSDIPCARSLTDNSIGAMGKLLSSRTKQGSWIRYLWIIT